MRIAILTCGILPIPAVQGGAVENLIDFYMEYNHKKKLHDITVYSPWDAKAANHPALSSDVNHYHYIDVTSLKARIARKVYGYFHTGEYYNYFIEYYFEKVYAILKRKNYDYIILENSPGHAYKLSQRGFKNLILHLHNDLLNSNTRYHDEIFKANIKILTVSNYIKERVSSIQPCDKIQTVYNGIDLKHFSSKSLSPISRKKMGFSEKDFVMIYSGRINNEKGISELIDALLLLKDFPKIKLLIIGGTFFNNTDHDDKFVCALKEKAKRVEDKITFTGFIPYHNVPNYLQLADIAIIPSMWDEPFGLTVVEAMAMGLPLIATKSGGIPEICEDVATIVDREHIVDNLVKAILDLYQHPEKRLQMSKASINRAKDFDKETFAQNFFAALENL